MSGVNSAAILIIRTIERDEQCEIRVVPHGVNDPHATRVSVIFIIWFWDKISVLMPGRDSAHRYIMELLAQDYGLSIVNSLPSKCT